jgi:uncharacterized coiled-coil protein SlyX
MSLKRIFSAFVEFDEKPKTQQTTAQSNQTSIPAAPLPVFKNVAPTVSSEEFEKFKKHFEDLMEQANLPGPDYYEFLKVEEKLENLIPDERTRFISAFASLSVNGLSKDILISSASKYIDVIEKDRAGFESALKQKTETEIGSRKTQIADAQTKIETANAKIQELTKELTEQQELIAELSRQITEVETAIKKNSEGFFIAHQAMMQTIQSDIQKITATL